MFLMDSAITTVCKTPVRQLHFTRKIEGKSYTEFFNPNHVKKRSSQLYLTRVKEINTSACKHLDAAKFFMELLF